jgi:hypothetical protein
MNNKGRFKKYHVTSVVNRQPMTDALQPRRQEQQYPAATRSGGQHPATASLDTQEQILKGLK